MLRQRRRPPGATLASVRVTDARQARRASSYALVSGFACKLPLRLRRQLGRFLERAPVYAPRGSTNTINVCAEEILARVIATKIVNTDDNDFVMVLLDCAQGRPTQCDAWTPRDRHEAVQRPNDASANRDRRANRAGNHRSEPRCVHVLNACRLAPSSRVLHPRRHRETPAAPERCATIAACRRFERSSRQARS
jgi:hypothetical protein